MGRMIFNFVSLVIFICIVVFVYFKFLKTETKQEISGLQFSVPTYFELTSSDTNSRYYISKDLKNACSIKVSYGPTSDPDNYADNFFASVKKMHETDIFFTKEKKSEKNINRRIKSSYIFGESDIFCQKK